jgi:protein-disulfide isomerase
MFGLLLAGIIVAGGTGLAAAQSSSPVKPGSQNSLQSKVPAKTLTPAEKKAIEDVLRSYILENPEVIIEAIQNLRERQARETREQASANLAKYHNELFRDQATPVGGNPKGDVTIIEFFDYRCGFCKRVFPDVMKVLNEDKNIRYVFKEFPILGPDSTTASKAALAAWLQDSGKYEPFHQALMQTKGALPESRVMRIAAEKGLDVKALKKTMEDPRINEMIEKNFALAKALDINGTPAFVIGDQVVRGAIDLASLRELISKARGS